MGVYIEDNMLVIQEPKTFHFNFDFPKHFGKNLKHEIEFIVSRNESLAKYNMKNEIERYCTNISTKTIFMNTENSKTNEPDKFVLSLPQKLDLKNSDKFVAV